MEPTKAQKFLGINNRLPASRLHQGDDATFVADAINGDFTDAGTFRRRSGSTLVLSGGSAHSFWTNGAEGYMADGGSLYHIAKNNIGVVTKTAIATVTPGRRFSFAAAAGVVYATNGIEFFRISGGTAVRAGIKSPEAPAVSAQEGGGALPKGVYMLAVSLRMSDGRDSGMSQVASVEFDNDGGAITIQYAPTVSGGNAILYMSPTNGDTLFEVAPVVSGAKITSVPAEGARAVAVLTQPLPAGQIVKYLNGRLFVASDNTVFFSLPYALELYDALGGSFQFPAPVTMVAPCIDGMYIAADRTYWLSTAEMRLEEVLPYGAVFGTDEFRKDLSQAVWMSHRGVIVGGRSGTIANMQEEVVAIPAATFGAAIFREENGVKQVVVSTFNQRPNTTAATAWIEAVVSRKENAV